MTTQKDVVVIVVVVMVVRTTFNHNCSFFCLNTTTGHKSCGSESEQKCLDCGVISPMAVGVSFTENSNGSSGNGKSKIYLYLA